jgi:rsbT co-antagonist protein RsbR
MPRVALVNTIIRTDIGAPVSWQVPCIVDQDDARAALWRYAMTNDVETIQSLRAENTRLQQRIAELEQTSMSALAPTSTVDLLPLLYGIIAHLPATLVVQDLQGHTLLTNQHGSTQDAAPPPVVNGSTAPAHFPAEVQATWQAATQQVSATGQAVELEVTVTHEHEARIFQVSAFPLYDIGENLIAIGGLMIEITGQRQVAEQLRLMRFSLDHCGDSVYWVDSAGRHRYVNDSACERLGYSHGELLTMRVVDIDLEMTEETWQIAWKATRKYGTLTFESLHSSKDARTLPVEIAAHYLEFEGKAFLCMFARDISGHKQMADELHTFQMLVENAPDAIGVTDMEGVVSYANLAYRTMYGYGDATIGMHFSDMVAPEAKPIISAAMQTVYKEGIWHGENINQRYDGGRFPVQSSIFALLNERGITQAIAMINRDMTMVKQTEHAQADLQQQIITDQQAALRELSTPLIPIADDVIMMPLIGVVDSQRAQQVLDVLVEGVARYQARMLILDITGMQVIDTQAAGAIIRAAHAVRLLGAQVILTGIGPEIAQTIVQQGIDLSEIDTRASLQAGIAHALYG